MKVGSSVSDIASATGSSTTQCLQSLFLSTATFQSEMQLNVSIKNTGPATAWLSYLSSFYYGRHMQLSTNATSQHGLS